jgi:gliding motility-associated-like protein
MKKNISSLSLILLLFSFSAYSQQPKIKIVTITPANGQSAICLGQSIALFAKAETDFGTPEIEFKWDNCKILNKCNEWNVIATPIVSTHFNVWARIKNDPDTTWQKVLNPQTIEVFQPPVLTIYIPQKDSSSCLNVPVEFYGKAEYVKPGTTRWSKTGNGELKADPDNELHVTYIPQPGETGNIVVTLSGDPYGPCSTASSFTSRILEIVSKPTVTLTPASAAIYNSTDIPLQLTGSVSNYTPYEWRVVPNNAGTLSSKTILNPTFMPNKDFVGVATIYLDAKNKGCVATAASVVTISKFDLNLYPDKNPVLCKGVKNTLEVGACTGCTYKWSTGETTSRIFVTPSQNTKINIEVRSQQGGIFRDTFNITVHDNPVITEIVAYPADKKIIVLPDGYEKYKFSVKGDTVQSAKNNAFYFTDYIGLTKQIDIRVINIWNCKADSLYPIVPRNLDAFTPNGDGINDKFQSGWHIIVFDRTQKVLYEGNDGWDGTFNGTEMPIGTYFYVLFDLQDKIAYKGPVTLLRDSIKK